jgi:hypothetical protein
MNLKVVPAVVPAAVPVGSAAFDDSDPAENIWMRDDLQSVRFCAHCVGNLH